MSTWAGVALWWLGARLAANVVGLCAMPPVGDSMRITVRHRVIGALLIVGDTVMVSWGLMP